MRERRASWALRRAVYHQQPDVLGLVGGEFHHVDPEQYDHEETARKGSWPDRSGVASYIFSGSRPQGHGKCISRNGTFRGARYTEPRMETLRGPSPGFLPLDLPLHLKRRLPTPGGRLHSPARGGFHDQTDSLLCTHRPAARRQTSHPTTLTTRVPRRPLHTGGVPAAF